MRHFEFFVGELRTVQFFIRQLSSIFTTRDAQFDFVAATIALVIENLVLRGVIRMEVCHEQTKFLGVFKVSRIDYILHRNTDNDLQAEGFIERNVLGLIRSRSGLTVDDYIKMLFSGWLRQRSPRPAREFIDLIISTNSADLWDTREARRWSTVGQLIIKVSPEAQDEIIDHLNDVVLNVVKARNSEINIKKFSDHIHQCVWDELEAKEDAGD